MAGTIKSIAVNESHGSLEFVSVSFGGEVALWKVIETDETNGSVVSDAGDKGTIYLLY